LTIRLAISVEGQTEESFVKLLLAPHLFGRGVFATPVKVSTGRNANGTKAKGGGINLDRVAHELRILLSTHNGGYVTSFYDFYGFGKRPPGIDVGGLEQQIAEACGSASNLIPYVQLHEFEALLLSDAEIAADYFQADRLKEMIAKAVSKAGTPEAVNDSPLTAPSKRLEQWTAQWSNVERQFSKATKVRHGSQLAARLTLPVVRAACPRFNNWLTCLESL
jgi:hypothetical protein